MGKNLYISDTHFGHANILKFDNRPFRDADEMQEIMIENWNQKVDKNDSIYILGDFCWGKDPEWKSILDRLNGSKFLIKGNHDGLNMSSSLKSKFAWIGDYKEVTDFGFRVIMSHYPMLFYKHNYDPNYYMLHGHVHKTLENDLLLETIKHIKHKDYRGAIRNQCQIINVGCMMPYMDYTPRTIQEIIQGSREWLEKNNLL